MTKPKKKQKKSKKDKKEHQITLDDLSIQHFNHMCISNVFVLILGITIGYLIGAGII